LAISDFTYPNGLAFSTDEKILYVNDTRGGNIRAFGMNPDGSVGPGRIFHTLTGDEDGVADRMKVGQNDSVYCTGPGGIHIINSSRDLIGRLLIPGHYANLAWGGDKLDFVAQSSLCDRNSDAGRIWETFEIINLHSALLVALVGR
jgi:gluconolactonase